MYPFTPQPRPLFVAALRPGDAGPVVFRVVGWMPAAAENQFRPVVARLGATTAATVETLETSGRTYAYAETAEHAMCAVMAPTWNRDGADQ